MIEIPENVGQVIDEPLKDGITLESLIDVATYVIPRLIPNISLSKREDVIPLLLCIAKLHPNSLEREKLYQQLFSLQKRPHDDDRQMILAGKYFIFKLTNAC